jgi:hypothetical protein
MVRRDSDDDHRKNAVMEKTRNDSDTAPAEGAATATAEIAHRECYVGLGEAAAYLNVLCGLDPL